MALRLALPGIALPEARIAGRRRTALIDAIGETLVIERNSVQMLLDRRGRGLAGQCPDASRVPPVIIDRERKRACRGLHALAPISIPRAPDACGASWDGGECTPRAPAPGVRRVSRRRAAASFRGT